MKWLKENIQKHKQRSIVDVWHPSTTSKHGGSKMNLPLLFIKSYTMCKHIKATDKTFNIVMTKMLQTIKVMMMCR